MAATVFEIFGYPVGDASPEAEVNRLAARCPFMGRDCDGGGNRYLSQIDLTAAKYAELQALYPGRKTLAAGVCSLQLAPDTSPWIVCPRRLLVLGRERAGIRTHQRGSEIAALKYLGYPPGTRLGVWPEVKLKYTETVLDLKMSFDYTFDYILMPVGSVDQKAIETATGIDWLELQRVFQNGGYTVSHTTEGFTVEDCPMGAPHIIEIMTSSTSGGNKTNRSTIPAAFEDALLHGNHSAPGINYRQVWARMVSQLIVKSEIGLNWGGKTLWVVQDALVDYICAKTALNIRQFLSEKTHEVNMLSFSYGQSYRQPKGVLDLHDTEFFAGPMTSHPAGTVESPSFQDMLRAPIRPSLSRLITLLAKRKPANYVIAP